MTWPQKVITAQPSLSGCKHRRIPWYPQWPTRPRCVRAQSSTSHRGSASSFSFCVCECMSDNWVKVVFFCACVCLTFSACCLLSIKSDPTTTSAAMHSDTLVLYLSSYMLSGLDCVWRQTRVKWWYDVRMSYCCCDIVLVFSACFEWTD